MYELRLLQRDRPESSGKKDRVEGGPMKGNFGKWKGAEGASQVCIFGVGGGREGVQPWGARGSGHPLCEEVRLGNAASTL